MRVPTRETRWISALAIAGAAGALACATNPVTGKRELALTTPARYESWKGVFQRSINSFDRLTDPVALAVQPMRLRIETAPRAMSLAEFQGQWRSSITLAELALINGVPEAAQLRAGQSIKRVIGMPMAHVGGQR
jgi:predicted Zn-dependent protease